VIIVERIPSANSCLAGKPARKLREFLNDLKLSRRRAAASKAAG
jgi:hypothetical protein